MTQEHWTQGTRLVLLGGGVGINPLVSILRHIGAWLEGLEGGGNDDKGFRVSLVHCAATADVSISWVKLTPSYPSFYRSINHTTHRKQELLFHADIEALAKQHPSIIDAQFICTQDPAWTGRRARIDAPLLWSLVPAYGASIPLCWPGQRRVRYLFITQTQTYSGGAHPPVLVRPGGHDRRHGARVHAGPGARRAAASEKRAGAVRAVVVSGPRNNRKEQEMEHGLARFLCCLAVPS